MSKTIFCVCGLYLGELAAGSKLKRNMVFLCSNCNTKRLASDMTNKSGSQLGNLNNVFGDLFRNR